MFDKLKAVLKRFEELEKQMSDPDIISNSAKYQSVAKEYGELEETAKKYREYETLMSQISSSKKILEEEKDPEIRTLAKDELEELKEKRIKVEEDLKIILLEDEGPERKGLIVEIRAGTGGDEAALFAGDLFRMYSKYADKRKWTIEILDENQAERGGFKEIIFSIHGKGAHKALQYEGGGHRVQRVPETETQGRVHTSAATVAVLPEVEPVEVNIRPEDIRIDTFRAGGPGGQKVNKTSSAIRITHLPTNLVVSCQDEKSQHKNKASAMRVLRSRLFDFYQSKVDNERSSARKSMIGSGDRSEKVRTYNYAQNRVTDHRINLTLYSLDKIMDGELDGLIEGIQQAVRQKQLSSMQ